MFIISGWGEFYNQPAYAAPDPAELPLEDSIKLNNNEEVIDRKPTELIDRKPAIPINQKPAKPINRMPVKSRRILRSVTKKEEEFKKLFGKLDNLPPGKVNYFFRHF